MVTRIILITVLVLLVSGAVTWLSWGRDVRQTPTTLLDGETTDEPTTYRYEDGPAECEVTEPPVLTHDVTDLAQIARIIPPAGVQERGELKTHSYLHNQPGTSVPVYAPARGVIRWGSHVIGQNTTGAFDPTLGSEYSLIIELDCRHYSFIDHLSDPAETIRASLPTEAATTTQTEFLDPPVPVAAGELLGSTRGTNPGGIWDFGLYDRRQQNIFPPSVTNASRRDEQARCAYDHYPAQQRAGYQELYDRAYPNYSRVLELCD